jgi:hypothetical protein
MPTVYGNWTAGTASTDTITIMILYSACNPAYKTDP